MGQVNIATILKFIGIWFEMRWQNSHWHTHIHIHGQSWGWECLA